MAERQVSVYIKPGVFVIETDLSGRVNDARTRMPDENIPFGVYKEAQGRVIFIHDICSVNGESLRTVIDYCQQHPRPAFLEVFPEVKIYDMYTKDLWKTLLNVDLTGILEGLKDVMRDKYGKGK